MIARVHVVRTGLGVDRKLHVWTYQHNERMFPLILTRCMKLWCSDSWYLDGVGCVNECSMEVARRIEDTLAAFSIVRAAQQEYVLIWTSGRKSMRLQVFRLWTARSGGQVYIGRSHNNYKIHISFPLMAFYSHWTYKSMCRSCVSAENILPVAAHEEAETIHNMTTENKLYFQAEKEAIFLILTGIGDEIYSTVDACNTAKEMWTAIERLQQGESLNVQDVKTNLFWEFGKFTSRDGESMESYYSRFYKLMNELTRNNLQVSTMQVNVQFLQQLQPEWSRFVTIVKQKEEIDKVSYHRLFDVLKQFQNEVNDIRSERLARSANPLALLAAAQPYSDNYYQAPKPQRSNAPSYMQSSSTRPSATTRHKGKEIAKPVTPQSESVSEEDSDPEQARRDKDMKKNLALLAKYFKKLYKPTNNNLRTSSNSRNKTEDTTPRKPKRVKDYAYHKEKMMMCKQVEQGVPLQAEQADWLEDTDEEIDEQELEAHYSYMAKIQEVSPEESSSTSQPLEQVQNHDENDVFANVRRHSEQPESINDTYVLEKDDSNVIPDSSNICTNDNQVDQNAAECVDERAALANLIANLTLDTEENKTVLKQLKKANASLTQELKECKTNLDESSRALGEATSSRDSSLIALQTKQTELEKYTALNDLTSDYKILQTKLNETLGLLALKDIDIKEGLKTKTYEISVVNQKHDELVKKSLLTRSQFEGQLKEKSKVISDLKVKEGKDIDTMIEMDKQIKFLNEILYKRNQSIQTIHMLAPKCATYHGRSTFANPKYLKRAQSDKPRLYEIPYDTSDPANRFCPDREETMTLEKESRSKLDKDKVKPYNYTYQNSLYETFKPPSKAYLDQLERAKEVRKTMWRKTFVRTKPNIAKNVGFLPMSKSISKSRLLYNEMTNNFNHFRTICQQTWSNHTSSAFPNPTAKSMEVLIKILLMPLSDKTILDSHCFVHELKKEMNDDLEYVNSLEKELDELESEKADFSNIYDLTFSKVVCLKMLRADQASVFMAMTFEQRSSSLVLHQMTSDHNRSELRIQDHSNEQSSSKLVPKVVVRLGINPMIQPEPEDLPKDNPKLEIAVLRYVWRRMYMGIMPTKTKLTLEQSQQGVSNDVLAETPVNTYAVRITVGLLTLKKDIMDPVNCNLTTLPTIRDSDNRNVPHLTMNTNVIEQYTARSGMDLKMAKTCFHSQWFSVVIFPQGRWYEVKIIVRWEDSQYESAMGMPSRVVQYDVNVAEGVNAASEEVSTAELVSTAYMICMRYFGEVFSRLEVVSLVDVVLDGAFGGVREEEVVVGDGVERFSLSLVRSTNSCFGDMIVSLILLNPWEEDACVSMEV
ncbi:hypothetical protein Tco_0363243 [Tanacetum coccineum]